MLFASLISTLLEFSQSVPVVGTLSERFALASSNTVGSEDVSDFNYESFAHAHSWPSVHESAIAARRILKIQGLSTLSSVFPSSQNQQTDSSASESASKLSRYQTAELFPYEDRPASVAGAAVGLMDYHASCAPHPYDPTIIGVTIATTMRNAAAGSNVTLSMNYIVPSPASPPKPPADDPWAYLPANLPRFSLIGYLERIPEDEVKRDKLDECFLKVHPDGRLWAPGGDLEPHESWWGRLRVREVYFFGGFGDRARISWLPLQEWQSVTDEEVDQFRLPGEPGWLEQKQKNDAVAAAAVGDDDEEEWQDPLFNGNESEL